MKARGAPAPARSDRGATREPVHAERRWPRAALGTVGTVAFGFAVLGLLFVAVGGIGPSDRELWLGLVALFALAAAGHRWRTEVPGRRDPHLERERRGF
jgi:hypothetical protein